MVDGYPEDVAVRVDQNKLPPDAVQNWKEPENNDVLSDLAKRSYHLPGKVVGVREIFGMVVL
tara:strand:- start:7190 stop:7375 length:186 start_codon:yes stop_codon:yes gene_type:complete